MLNQGSRNLQLHVPCFGDGVLIPVEARAKEAVSESFLCSIECISNNLNIDGHALLGNNAALVFLDKEGSKRYLNGVISQFTSGLPPGKSAKSVNSHAIRRYHLQLIPQFELLDHGSNCQFFKDMTVPEIFQTHCKKLGFHNFDMTGLSQKYKPLTYKTQFNETNFNFLSRILEEAGISYYYQHSKDEHTLMLVDNPLKFKNSQITVNSVHADETDFSPVSSLGTGTPALFSWETKQTVSPLQTCMSPLNDSQPNHWDYPTALSTGRNKVAMRPGLYCIMHYPNSLTDRDSRHQAQSALTNALAAEQMMCEGSGNCIHFSAGHTFLLNSEKTGPWLITEIHHHAFDYSYLPENAAKDETIKTAGYSNTFKHINTQKTPYAPKRTLKKPLIPDLQPAFVTGPEGYEKAIYTNPLGQVQVRFPWDRSGQNSCFIDVKHSAAGSDFGTQFIPGIGQEVLVSYVGGDIDMPMIVGSVANGKTAPACNLSENPNLTWIKSNSAGHSTDHSAGQGHHILFDDTPGKEQLTLQSQKDYIEEILGNSTLTIEGDDEIRIDGNDNLHALSEALKLQGKTLTLSGGGSELIISEHGIELKGSAASGGRVELCSKGAGPMKPVARLGDKYACAKRTAGTPHHGGPIVSAAAGITVNKLGIARQGDKGHCRITTDHIKEGIASILVAGKPVARLNHAMKHGGVITSASENVFVGERAAVPNLVSMPLIDAAHPCIIDTFHIRCQHHERSFQLQPLTGKPNVDEQKYVLQVIASDKVPDKLLLFFKGHCHQQPQILNGCPQMEVAGPDTCQVFHDNQLVEVYGPSNLGIKRDLSGFLKQILLPLSNPNQYTLTPCTCIETGPEVTVDVYPPVKWEGELSLGYKFDKEDAKKEIRDRYNAMQAAKGDANTFNHAFQKNAHMKLKEKGTWDLDGSISITRNNQTWSLGGGVEKEGEEHSKHKAADLLFKGVRSVMDNIIPVINSMDSHLGKIELKLPKLSLGGGIENKEVPGKYDVDLVGEIKVAFDPLLELDFEIDILNWLIAFLGPGLGTFLLKIKDEAQKGVGSCSEDGKEKKFGMAANVNINLTANGKIKGSAIWKKEIDGDWNFDGKTVTSLTLALSGNAGGYVKAFHIQAGGGAYTYAETGFELILKPGAVYCENSKRHLPGITIQTGFRGLTIYYIYYRDYSYSNSLTPTRSAEPPSNSEIKRKISVEHKYMKSAVIIHEKLWPSKPWTVPISSGVI